MLFVFSISMFLFFFCLIFYNIKKKKIIGGEDVEKKKIYIYIYIYSFDSLLDIAYIFA
jgi:hypothetical protein